MARWQIPRSGNKPTGLKGHVWFFFRDVLWGTAIGAVLLLGVLYKVLAGWWFEPLVGRWARKQFLSEIRTAMPFLFEVYGGTAVPSPRPGAESGQEETVYIKAGGLLFCFARWHDELLEARVADSARPNDMYFLDDVLSVVDTTRETSTQRDVPTLHQYANLIERNFTRVASALSEERVAKTRQKITEIRSARTRY